MERQGRRSEYKAIQRPALKVLRELLSDEQLAGYQHFGFKLYKNSQGSSILACGANGSITFQLAQMSVGPETVPAWHRCLNNDRTVMSHTHKWRPLVCLPILKGSSCTNVNKDWQAYHYDLYHSAMAPIIADVNHICSTDRHFRFADPSLFDVAMDSGTFSASMARR